MPSLFNRLRSALTGKQTNTPAAPAPTTLPDAEETITVFDAYGREVHVTRDEWRTRMFLPSLQANWNDADELYRSVISGVNDGFASDLIPAAERLLQIDTFYERSHTVHGIVLMKNDQLDAAETTLRAGMEKAGATATLLTNLAKVHAERGDQKRADDTLWQALQADPNQENGLMWWLLTQQERDGDAGYLHALHAAVALPHSWRPQLLLARHHLTAGEVDSAQALYEQVLQGGQYDNSALTMISADLGSHGKIALIAALVAPVFDEGKHEPMAGLNLLRTWQELGNPDEGEALLDRMYACSMPPLRQHLDHFAQVFQQMRQTTTPGTPLDVETLDIASVSLNLPIWQYGLRGADWLFAQKPAGAPIVAFFSLSKIMHGHERAESQREDELGRYARAISVYLAEAAHYWTDYAASTCFEVVKGHGLALSGSPTDGNALFDLMPQSMRYFVTGEIGSTGSGDVTEWRVDLTVWDCHARATHASHSGTATQAELGTLVLTLEQQVLHHLGRPRAQPCDAFYQRPAAPALPTYLNALGQAVTLSLAANDYAPKSSLWGERAMLEWPLRMALQWPAMKVPALMYLSGLGMASDYQSDVLPEFKERSLQLLRETEPADSPALRLAPLVWQAFGMKEMLAAHRASQPAEVDPAYLEWLDRVAT